MKTRIAIAAIALLDATMLATMTAATAAQSDLQAEIRAKDQAMMDAFATGDGAVFDSTLAPEAVYLDENGTLMDRATFLGQLHALPANVSGHIELGDYRFNQFGSLATVTYMAHETENYHGQILHTDFLTSETWRKSPAGWRLTMTQTMVPQRDPPEISLPREELAAYAGKYRGGPDLEYVIKVEDGKLLGERPGRTAATLRPEVKDVFFIAGQPRTRKIFQRDGSGSIIGFVDRREGIDIVWRRVVALHSIARVYFDSAGVSVSGPMPTISRIASPSFAPS